MAKLMQLVCTMSFDRQFHGNQNMCHFSFVRRFHTRVNRDYILRPMYENLVNLS